MEKEKFLWCVWGSIGIIIIGILFLVFPLLTITNLDLVFKLFLGGFTIVSLLEFLFQYKNKEYSSFIIFAASIIILCVSFVFKLTDSPRVLALSLLAWLLFAAFAKIKKADFFHDRKSKVWCLEISMLVLLFIAGLLTSANFAFNSTTSVLILGYFTFLYGVLDLQENLLIYLTKGKIK